jgi:hypothetical protein
MHSKYLPLNNSISAALLYSKKCRHFVNDSNGIIPSYQYYEDTVYQSPTIFKYIIYNYLKKSKIKLLKINSD